MAASVRNIPTFILILLAVSACDSSPTAETPAPPETGPAGTWLIDPISFRLNLIVDAANGITEDIQGTIEGTLNLSETDGVLSGTGICSWTTRRHTARLSQTIEGAGTESVTITGSLDGTDARLVLQGCAWNQVGYRGSFAEERYDLAIPPSADGPLFGPDIWTEARFLSGDDPARMVLARE
ncbi:MAG: hypothetical protein ACI80V_001976 [Rhodothermales bacterium]|jgi:hypothetical protein